MHRRFNVDSIPFNLEQTRQRSFAQPGDDHVQISGPESGDKRFGTIHMILHGGAQVFQNPKLAMIFRGKGNFLEKERDSYHPQIVALAQEKAWLDDESQMSWYEELWKPFAEEYIKKDDHLVFADNLHTQKKANFVRKMQELGGEMCFGPPNKTEGWQPIDCGHLGAVLKTLAKGAFETWADETDEEGTTNWEKWENKKFSASEKRVLVSWWFGEAWTLLRPGPFKSPPSPTPTHNKICEHEHQPLEILLRRGL